LSSVKNLSAQAKLRLETARANHGWLDVVLTTFKRFSDQDGGFYAAGLTYYIFFSVFPLVLFGVSALGFAIFLSDSIKQDIIDASADAFPLVTQVLQPDTLDNLATARFSLAAAGLVLVLYSGTGGIVALEHALNRIRGLDQEGTFVQKRLRALRFLATVGIIPLFSVALGAAARLAQSPVASVLALVGGALLSVLLFATAFKFLPSVNPSWRDVLPGAVIAGAIFEVLKIVGPLYLGSGRSGRDATFGAFAATAGLLISAYLLSQVTLLAAQLNAVLAERRQSREFSLADKDKEAP
ncbi:MAG TPA: YihY/virulence factor BrkB family protein, partial [Actinomycetota bacterium]|nr:YihY/virulence factor BrkB family protein [Actinomycetota bacterium]